LMTKGPIWVLGTHKGKKKGRIDLFPPLRSGAALVATPNSFIIADGLYEIHNTIIAYNHVTYPEQLHNCRRFV